MTYRLALAACFVIAVAGRAAALDEPKDRWWINGMKYEGLVITESSTTLTFKMGGGATQNKPMREVKGLVYGGMLTEGLWRTAMDEKSRGRYEDASERFGQLADSGTKEWEKVYGAMQEGECLELAHKYADAAKAYQKVVVLAPFDKDDKQQPRHRLWLDACYHLGMAQAMAKQADDAAKVADGLATFSKLKDVANPNGAQGRSDAVRAAIAGVAGDSNAQRSFSQKVIFRDGDEPEVWFHFNYFLADTYRTAKQPKDALTVLSTMMDAPSLAANPARMAQIELLRGLCLMDTDPQGAVVSLLKIDLLPYGSEEQKCLARFQAGRLLLAEADKLKAKPKPGANDAEFTKELIRTARLLLDAAVDSTAAMPEKADAKALLDKLGPEEGAAPAAPEGEKTDKPAEKSGT